MIARILYSEYTQSVNALVVLFLEITHNRETVLSGMSGMENHCFLNRNQFLREKLFKNNVEKSGHNISKEIE